MPIQRGHNVVVALMPTVVVVCDAFAISVALGVISVGIPVVRVGNLAAVTARVATGRCVAKTIAVTERVVVAMLLAATLLTVSLGHFSDAEPVWVGMVIAAHGLAVPAHRLITAPRDA